MVVSYRNQDNHIIHISGSISWCRAKQNDNDLLVGPGDLIGAMNKGFSSIRHCAVNVADILSEEKVCQTLCNEAIWTYRKHT